MNIKIFFKRLLFCKHEYYYTGTLGMKKHYTCKKCGKKKVRGLGEW